jgi:hypothetical protein
MPKQSKESPPFEETLRQLSIQEGRRYRAGPWRLEGIINDIVENDMTTFHCHKTAFKVRW